MAGKSSIEDHNGLRNQGTNLERWNLKRSTTEKLDLHINLNRTDSHSRSFENSYIPENPRTPKPLTFSKNRLREAKNRSNISPVAKKNFRKNDFFFSKNFAYVSVDVFITIHSQLDIDSIYVVPRTTGGQPPPAHQRVQTPLTFFLLSANLSSNVNSSTSVSNEILACDFDSKVEFATPSKAFQSMEMKMATTLGFADEDDNREALLSVFSNFIAENARSTLAVATGRYTSGVRSLAGALVGDFPRWGNQVVWFRAHLATAEGEWWQTSIFKWLLVADDNNQRWKC
ncbi:hypothetical protein LXL04_002184 [Taraxacum kok-saghyz]